MSKNKNSFNNEELLMVMDKIRIALYLIVALLLINVIVNTVNSSNTWSLREEGSAVGGSGNNNTNSSSIEEFDEVDYSGLEKIMESDGTYVVYIGRESCGYCEMFIPIMIEAQEKYDFTTTYFDITRVFNYSTNSIVDNDAYEKLSDYNDFFEENFLSTPMVVIFKDGKYVDGTVGYQDIDTYSSFLEENGFKEK